jgi:putative transposase
MKRTRFTETQVVAILKKRTAECWSRYLRKHGISDATYYNWKSKYGGMEASDLKRMKELEQELSKFKRMYVDLAYENHALKDLIEKLWAFEGVKLLRQQNIACR